MALATISTIQAGRDQERIPRRGEPDPLLEQLRNDPHHPGERDQLPQDQRGQHVQRQDLPDPGDAGPEALQRRPTGDQRQGARTRP